MSLPYYGSQGGSRRYSLQTCSHLPHPSAGQLATNNLKEGELHVLMNDNRIIVLKCIMDVLLKITFKISQCLSY